MKKATRKKTVRKSTARGLKNKSKSTRVRGISKAKFHLKLYICGYTGRSQTALKNLEMICEKYLKGMFDLKIINLLESPQLAKNDHVIAAPTLVKVIPHPLSKIIGDLSNTEKVLAALNISPALPD